MEAPSLYGPSDDKRPAIIGTSCTLLVIGNLCVAARCLTHLRSLNKIYVEDVFLLLAMACGDVVIGNLLAAASHGLGLHTTTVNASDPHVPQRLAEAFKHVWVVMILNGPTFTLIKLSLLFFYRRMFLVHQHWLRIAWWANMIYILLWFLGATGFYIFQCWPVSWYWRQYYEKFHTQTSRPEHGQCDATTVGHVALPLIFGLISDVALLLLPTVTLSQLQMSTKKRIGMLGIFSVGSLACVLELVRIIELEIDTDDKTDASYNVVTFLILSAAAEVVAIICACLPVIAPKLFKQYHGSHVSGKLRMEWGTESQRDSRGFKRLFGKDIGGRGEVSRGEAHGDRSGEMSHDIPMVKLAHKSGRSSANMESNQEVFMRTDVEVTTETMESQPSVGKH